MPDIKVLHDPAITAPADRATAFGSVAAAYARARPDYPEPAIRWLLEPLAQRRDVRIVDLGAGTGKLTEGLLRLAPDAEIVAVEPDQAMLAQLRARVAVPAVIGTAESIPLPDSSVDLIVAGQALHWFDLETALPEFARILKPNGWAAGIWNFEDSSVEWVRGLQTASGSMTSVSLGRQEEVELERGGYFAGTERAQFPHGQRRTAATMLDTRATNSHFVMLPEHERAAVLDEIRSYLARTPETANGDFVLPIITKAVRVSRSA